MPELQGLHIVEYFVDIGDISLDIEAYYNPDSDKPVDFDMEDFDYIVDFGHIDIVDLE